MIEANAMAWIRLPPVSEATGLLKAEYDAAIARAGRVWEIVKIKGLNPLALKQSIGLYATLMRGPSPLTRPQREMLAVVVSRANDCHY
jgi:alkylhydroperoxidase family enzyme